MEEEPTLADIDSQSAYAPDGTDLTLIRWMLSMTPAERLDALQGFIDALWKVRAPTPKPEFRSMLQALAKRQVDFIVVGGVALVLSGGAYNNLDLDVVHSTDAANIAKLVPALEELDAYYRLHPKYPVRPNASDLTFRGHRLLLTRSGPLDLFGMIGKDRTYADLLPHCVWMELNGLRIRVLDVETQIAVKEEAGRDKDQPGLFLLRNVLEESRKKG